MCTCETHRPDTPEPAAPGRGGPGCSGRCALTCPRSTLLQVDPEQPWALGAATVDHGNAVALVKQAGALLRQVRSRSPGALDPESRL